MRDIRRAANEIRRQYGLDPVHGPVTAASAQLPLIVVPSCPEFDYKRNDLPSCVRYVGHCAWHPDDACAGELLSRLPTGNPWVHVSEGTMYTGDPVLLRSACSGLGGLPMQVIMTTGEHRNREQLRLGPVASNITITSWIPHPALFPRTQVVVTHGGGGTVMAALASGVPMVVVPFMWDQPENAQRVAWAGAGVVLSPARCTPERLRAAVNEVLANPKYKANASRIACALQRYGGLAEAAPVRRRSRP